jgi:hypothetical protein
LANFQTFETEKIYNFEILIIFQAAATFPRIETALQRARQKEK